MIVLSSTILSASAGLGRPMPKLLPWAAYPFPLIRFARSRLRTLPASHMPPQAAVLAPLRMEILRTS
jgi:hypothetical protein